tara:strand:- start:861 stop:1070 length:210 start_codon:yes stop_codon:yes gene_type:complete
MNKKINIRVSENLYNKIKENERDFGTLGTSNSVRRLIEIAFHLTKDMTYEEKVRLAMEVIMDKSTEVNS